MGGKLSARNGARKKPVNGQMRPRLATGPDHPNRCAALERKTRETQISIELALDGAGRSAISTGVPFLDHMLDSFARHGFFDLKVQARGDTEIDDHHTVEDVGIVIGRAFSQALGDRTGIKRFGSAVVPLDEALCTSVVELSGRSYLAYNVKIKQERVGSFQTELVHDFLKALSDEARMNLHVIMHSGRNPHHMIETIFKSLAKAMDQATAVEPRVHGVLSTKGTLS
jgi:imidazoleglycerol-phosphate dehydratase